MSTQKLPGAQLADKFEIMAPVDLQEEFGRQKEENPQVLHDAIRWLESRIVHAVRVRTYLDNRDWGLSHEAAVKHSNRAVARVRKSLGFTYPKDDIIF